MMIFAVRGAVARQAAIQAPGEWPVAAIGAEVEQRHRLASWHRHVDPCGTCRVISSLRWRCRLATFLFGNCVTFIGMTHFGFSTVRLQPPKNQTGHTLAAPITEPGGDRLARCTREQRLTHDLNLVGLHSWPGRVMGNLLATQGRRRPDRSPRARFATGALS
jgi:hypothetical protein